MRSLKLIKRIRHQVLTVFGSLIGDLRVPDSKATFIFHDAVSLGINVCTSSTNLQDIYCAADATIQVSEDHFREGCRFLEHQNGFLSKKRKRMDKLGCTVQWLLGKYALNSLS